MSSYVVSILPLLPPNGAALRPQNCFIDFSRVDVIPIDDKVLLLELDGVNEQFGFLV